MGIKPSVGSASRDDTDERLRQEQEQRHAKLLESAAVNAEHHLCQACRHATICAVAAAVRSVNGEGDITISQCGAFEAQEGAFEPQADVVAEASE